MGHLLISKALLSSNAEAGHTELMVASSPFRTILLEFIGPSNPVLIRKSHSCQAPCPSLPSFLTHRSPC